MDKTRTTVRISADSLQFAKFADINLSKTLEGALPALQVEEAKRLWLAENTEALEDYNDRIDRDGVFGEEFQRF
ncbi:MAG: type II toxin-antitoxin system CcdA family antitoxin [Alphaproteobacteria bacterium]